MCTLSFFFDPEFFSTVVFTFSRPRAYALQQDDVLIVYIFAFDDMAEYNSVLFSVAVTLLLFGSNSKRSYGFRNILRYNLPFRYKKKKVISINFNHIKF